MACKRLIDRANQNGGPDNITVVVARFDGEALESASEGDAVGHQVYAVPGEATPTVPMEPFRRHTGTPPTAGILTSDPAPRLPTPAGHGPRRVFVLLLLLAVLGAAALYLFQHITITP